MFTEKMRQDLIARNKKFKWFLGHHISEENKKKISILHTGNKYNLGYKHSPETLIKMSIAHRGYKHSEESKLKMSISRRGKISPLRGRHHRPESIQKMIIAHTGKHPTEETRKKLRNHRHTQETKEKIRIAHLEHNNAMWSGDSVGYTSLHEWIKRRLPKPELCVCCKERKPYDLANKGTYNRDLNNWEWLCRKCHMTKDGRLENLIKNRYIKPRKEGKGV